MCVAGCSRACMRLRRSLASPSTFKYFRPLLFAVRVRTRTLLTTAHSMAGEAIFGRTVPNSKFCMALRQFARAVWGTCTTPISFWFSPSSAYQKSRGALRTASQIKKERLHKHGFRVLLTFHGVFCVNFRGGFPPYPGFSSFSAVFF